MNVLMTRKDASLAQWRAFLRIAERGSLSAAAKDLGTTQPTVSRQLKELEHAYGTTLVIRTTRSLRLTDSGKRVYELAELIVQSDDALRDQLLGNRTQIEGHLRIAAASGFGAFVVAPFCSRFMERHPKVTIDLRLSDLPVDLIDEGVDVAVRIGRLSSSSLYAKPLALLEEVLVCHPSCLTRPVTRPADLSRLAWTGFSGLKNDGAIRLERHGGKYTVKVTPRLRIDQIVGHREALLAGAGIGMIHRYAVEADLLAGSLIRLLPDWALPEWPVHAVFPLKTQSHRLQRWLEEFKAELADVAGVVPK
jgi:DNA-binding transcriptional LysR family regulator